MAVALLARISRHPPFSGRTVSDHSYFCNKISPCYLQSRCDAGEGASRPLLEKPLRFSIVTSDNNFTKLRISRAYVKLMCLPEGDARMISLAWIGNYEICMLEAPPTSSGDEPLFLMELFDHDEQSSVESRVCYDIDGGAAAFEAFASR